MHAGPIRADLQELRAFRRNLLPLEPQHFQALASEAYIRFPPFPDITLMSAFDPLRMMRFDFGSALASVLAGDAKSQEWREALLQIAHDLECEADRLDAEDSGQDES